MMRLTSALVCAIALAACSGGESGNHGGGVDAHPSTVSCGDGVCDSSEVNTCVADCGTPGQTAAVCGNGVCETSKGESATSCPGDCGGGGSGSGSGGGSGSGALNCSDQNTLLACLVCSIDPTQCVGVDPVACQACLGGGGGSGSGSGSCNFDGVCDPGEDPTTCLDCLLGSGGGSGSCNFDGVCDPGEDPTTCPTDCP